MKTTKKAILTVTNLSLRLKKNIRDDVNLAWSVFFFNGSILLTVEVFYIRIFFFKCIGGEGHFEGILIKIRSQVLP